MYGVNDTDGASIVAGVVQAKNGMLYGGSTEGGDTSCTYGCGVIFDASVKGKQAATSHGVTTAANLKRLAIPATPLDLLHR